MSRSFVLEKRLSTQESKNDQPTEQHVAIVPHALTRSSNFTRHELECDEGGEEEEEEAKMDFLKQLEESVESAKEEVLRTRELLVRAVWYNVMEARPKSGKSRVDMWAKLPPRAPVKDSVPLSVAERRAQLHEQSSLQLLQPRLSDAEEDVPTTSHALHERPPFVPPNRFPTMPPLKSSDYAHFNYTLYHAVLTAHSQGLLMKKRTGKRKAGTSVGDASHTENLTLRRDAMRTAIATHQQTSASASRLQRPHEKTFSCIANPKAVASQGPRQVQEREEEEEEGLPCQSVSVIILRIALKRANATLFVRQLRLTTFQRRLFLEEIALREKFYIQRRYMMRWRWLLYVAQRQRQATLQVCVEMWRAAVNARRRIHDVCTAYCSGLLQRRAARLRCEEKRRGRLFRRWIKLFLHKRFMRTLYVEADAFYKGIEKQRNHYVDVFAQPQVVVPLAHMEPDGQRDGESTPSPPPPISNRLAAKHALDHWHARYKAREILHTVEQKSIRRSAARVLRVFVCHLRKRLTAQLEAPASPNSPRIILLPSPQNKENEIPPSAIDGRVLSRQFRVHVDGGHEELLSYKNACARRVAQGALLQNCFQRWRSRTHTRRARQYWQLHATTQCMRHWLCRAARKYQQREVVQTVFLQWKARWAQRRNMRAATYFYLLKMSSAVWDRWKEVQKARQQYKKQLLAHSLHRWYGRAASAVSLRIAEEKQKQGVFSRWMQRFTLRRKMGDALLVADTIRETILLIGCMRAWRERFHERRRCTLQTSILTELRDEQLCRHCFERWKRKAFGPRQLNKQPLEALAFS